MTEAQQYRTEYFRETLLPVCGEWNYNEFRDWIEESNWCVFESSNRSWINTKTRKVISTETLYQLYATESKNNNA